MFRRSCNAYVSLTIGNIAPKCLWLIIDWMSTGWHDGIVRTEVDYISFRHFVIYRHKSVRD